MSGLAAENLSVRIGSKTILSGIDLSFKAGEITAILGPNGAGKSTLLSALAGLRRVDEGAVRLDAADISSLAPRMRAARIGYLPQNPEIAWAVDVETLVGLGRTPHHGAMGASETDHIAVAHALILCNLVDFARRDILTLSGGERMRALIARVLAGEPDWILADEPLTGLDPRHKLELAHLLKSFAAGGKGVVITLHDLDFALRFADRCILLLDGSLLTDGPAQAALTPEIIRTAYGVSARILRGEKGSIIEVLELD